ncbi:MAG: hypothetical protein R3B93_26320 [Bacteroidia bacterium]
MEEKKKEGSKQSTRNSPKAPSLVSRAYTYVKSLAGVIAINLVILVILYGFFWFSNESLSTKNLLTLLAINTILLVVIRQVYVFFVQVEVGKPTTSTTQLVLAVSVSALLLFYPIMGKTGMEHIYNQVNLNITQFSQTEEEVNLTELLKQELSGEGSIEVKRSALSVISSLNLENKSEYFVNHLKKYPQYLADSVYYQTLLQILVKDSLVKGNELNMLLQENQALFTHQEVSPSRVPNSLTDSTSLSTSSSYSKFPSFILDLHLAYEYVSEDESSYSFIKSLITDQKFPREIRQKALRLLALYNREGDLEFLIRLLQDAKNSDEKVLFLNGIEAFISFKPGRF